MAVQPQGCVPALYRPRRPADTPLYRVVQDHLETFLSRVTENAIDAEAGSARDPDTQPAPAYEYDQRVSW